MNNENQSMNKDLRDSVLGKIRSGELTMRPRAYFVLKIALLAFLALLVFITTAFLASFLCFDLHESHRLELLGFGEQGLFAFFTIFPWTIFFADIALLAVFEVLFRHFRIGYRKPFAYIIGGTLVVLVGASLVLCEMPLHSSILGLEESGHLPVIGGMYAETRRSSPDQGVFRGTVTSVASSTFMIIHNDGDRDWDEGNCTVFVPHNFDIQSLRPGDQVLVAGSYEGNRIRAYGIQRIGNGPNLGPSDRGMH
jgi:hypothetical protein